MRDCKVWLGLPLNYNGDGTYPCTASSLILQDIIRREVCGVNSLAELNRKYDIMRGNLSDMFVGDELAPRSYRRLTDVLLSEYLKRREALNE